MPEQRRQNIDQASAAWQTAAWKFGTLWCDFMHDAPMWPIHGEYECRICGRRYLVPWAGDTLLPAPAELTAAEPARIRRAGVPSFRSASLLLIVTLVFLLASPVQAADEPIVDSTGRAAMAFGVTSSACNGRAPGLWKRSRSMPRCRSLGSRDGYALFVVCCRLAGRNIRCLKSQETRLSGSR